MASNLTSLLNSTGNKFASVVNDGVIAGDISGYIDTGSYSLNALLSGSIYRGAAQNKITGFGSPSSTGKTFFALGILDQFLKTNPTGMGFVFESESAISRDMFIARGIDPMRVGIIPVQTVQEFRNQCLKLVQKFESIPAKERPPILLVLDSLGMLSTDKEMADSAEGKDTRDMTRAQLLKSVFRVLTLTLGRCNIPLILTNHTYATMELYSTQVQTGGSGMIYAASSIVSLTKAKDKEVDTGPVTGSIITCTLTKGRLAKENSKVKVRIHYTKGLDRYYGLLEIAEAGGITKKVGNKIQFPNGESAFAKAIYKNPEKWFTKDVLDSIDAYCATMFSYGSADADDEEENDDETES